MMANPSRSKGTAFENEVLEDLKFIWADADRAKAGNKSNDFTGIPFPIEAKHRKAWDIRNWVRKIQEVAEDHRWVIVAADGDRRKSSSPGTIAVVDPDFLYELLERWVDMPEIFSEGDDSGE